MSNAIPFIICNPAAGGGRAAAQWAEFSPGLRRQGVDFAFAHTTGPGEGARLAADAVAGGFRRIAAFGGDGTLHEVVQGLMSVDAALRGEVELVFLAAGTSCDFNKRFPLQSLTDRLVRGRPHPVDLIRLQCHDLQGSAIVRWAANASNVGVIADATAVYGRENRLMRLARRMGPDVAASAAGLGAIVRHRPLRGVLSVDGEPAVTRVLSSLSVYKTPWVTGHMRLGAPVDAADGSLGLLTFSANGRLALMAAMASLFTGGVERHRQTESRRCRCVQWNTPGAWVEADGEMVGLTPVHYTVVPGTLNVVI